MLRAATTIPAGETEALITTPNLRRSRPTVIGSKLNRRGNFKITRTEKRQPSHGDDKLDLFRKARGP